MNLEAKPDEFAGFSIRYADKIGGKREFRFLHAADLAEHVQQNRPALFYKIPNLGERYEQTMENMRSKGYRLPSSD